MLTAAALTDPGKVRPYNEDAFVILPGQGLFIVADGMGGRNAGATAAKIVVEVLPKMIEKSLKSFSSAQTENILLTLRDVITDLSQQLWKHSTGRTGLAGMGAAVVLVYCLDNQAFIAHMGDSRAYLYRNGRLKQLTEDHSVVALLLKDKTITPKQAKNHPARGVLTRYLGMESVTFPDVLVMELRAADRLLLCTDGLAGDVSDDSITKILGEFSDPAKACQALVDEANRKGGHDNITVLVACWSAKP